MTAGESRSTRRAEIRLGDTRQPSSEGVLTSNVWQLASRLSAVLASGVSFRSAAPRCTETGLPHDHATFVAHFPHNGKTPAQAGGPCRRHCGELRRIVDSDLRFIRSDPVSSKYCSEAIGATHPIADV